MIDLIKSIIKSFNERIKNPIVGSFIISFIFYNWRMFSMFCYSTNSIEKKIIEINEIYNQSSIQVCHFFVLNKVYLYPLIFSLIYNISLPYIKWFLDIIKTNPEKGILSIQKDYKDKILAHELEHAKEERKILEEKKDLASRIDELNRMINSLDNANHELKNKLINYNFSMQ